MWKETVANVKETNAMVKRKLPYEIYKEKKENIYENKEKKKEKINQSALKGLHAKTQSALKVSICNNINSFWKFKLNFKTYLGL